MDASAFTQGNGSHFFKFILEDTLCLGKLMIPRDYSAKYGDSLPSVATLELPSGERWQVELLKNSAREIWFDKGFKEFAQHCCLGHGNVLIFKYDKKNLFHVQVFQGTGLEIGYPDKPAVEVKMEKDEDYPRYMFESSSEDGVARAPKVKMEHNEDGFQRAPKLNNENARQGVKTENIDDDSHRVKKASKGTVEKDGTEVKSEPVPRRSGRFQAEGVSKLHNGKTSEEVGDETDDDDDDDWGEDDDDSEDEDYVDVTMDDDVVDDDDDDYDGEYAQALLLRSGRKKPERASKPTNGRNPGNRNGKRGEMEGQEGVGNRGRKQGEGCSMEDVDEDADADEDYVGFLDAMFG